MQSRAGAKRVTGVAHLRIFRVCSENLLPGTQVIESRSLLDRDAKAERFRLTDMTAHGAFRVAAIKVVGPSSSYVISALMT